MRRTWIILPILLLLTGCGFFGEKPYTELQKGVDIVEVNAVYTDGGCLLIDGETSYVMNPQNTIDVTTISDQILTYTYTLDDTEYACYRGVKIIDQTPPVITLLPGIDTVVVNTEHIDAGITYSDNHLVDTVTQTSTVDITTIGTYTITYTVTDVSGNQTTMIRVVEVTEN